MVLFQAEEKKSEEFQSEILTRLQEDEHLKEVSVKREEKVETDILQEQEPEPCQQEEEEQETSEQEVAEDTGKEIPQKEAEAEEEEITEEILKAGEGYILCTKAGDAEIQEEKKVIDTYRDL